MDSRLFRIDTRPGQLRQQDLPVLARALVGYHRKQVKVKTGNVRNLSYVSFEGRGIQVQILANDWAKILPYVQDGSFNQSLVKSQGDSVYLDPKTAHDTSYIDSVDQQYYLRVLGILIQLFGEVRHTKKYNIPVIIDIGVNDSLHVT